MLAAFWCKIDDKQLIVWFMRFLFSVDINLHDIFALQYKYTHRVNSSSESETTSFADIALELFCNNAPQMELGNGEIGPSSVHVLRPGPHSGLLVISLTCHMRKKNNIPHILPGLRGCGSTLGGRSLI